MNRVSKCLALLFAMTGATVAQAGTLTVTSPSSGDFLGLNNTVSFNIVNASTQVTVRVRATQVANPAIQVEVETKVTPNAQGEASGSVQLNFTTGFPSGDYTLNVTPTEVGGFYPAVPPINVTVDVVAPKFLAFNPLSNGFVRDSVLISALLEETNMKEWRVKVGGADIPNNTGSTVMLSVNWDTSLELTDGPKSIVITADDQAKNSVNQTINVTLDRLPPISTVLAPTSSDRYFGNARVPVVVQIADQFAGAVDDRTVEVFIRDTNGNFVTRVARRSVNNNGATMNWTGRIRDISQLPSIFDVVVQATDKAGNSAVEQTVRIERNRSGVHIQNGNQSSEEPGSDTVVDKGIMWRKGTIIFGLRRRH
ncbi:MAG: hypothetical protein JNM28_06285 [Armatimonadetes bacterium]|nr:hypothetical protein [Armatimonadota bacterium]